MAARPVPATTRTTAPESASPRRARAAACRWLAEPHLEPGRGGPGVQLLAEEELRRTAGARLPAGLDFPGRPRGVRAGGTSGGRYSGAHRPDHPCSRGELLAGLGVVRRDEETVLAVPGGRRACRDGDGDQPVAGGQLVKNEAHGRRLPRIAARRVYRIARASWIQADGVEPGQLDPEIAVDHGIAARGEPVQARGEMPRCVAQQDHGLPQRTGQADHAAGSPA